MNILYLAHRIPYPPNKGDKIRSFHQIRYLSRRHRVHLCCLVDDKQDLAHLRVLADYCASVHAVYRDKTAARCLAARALWSKRPLSVAAFYSGDLRRRIDQQLASQQIDRILVFSSAMAEYVRNVPRVPKVMDFVDVDSEKWRLYAAYHRFPISHLYKLEASRLAHYEEEIANSFDHSIFVSDREASLLRRRLPDRPISVIPNGVDLDYFYPNGQDVSGATRPTIVFTAAMDYFPNVDAVQHFCQDIFPRVLKAVPEARFNIVGRNPARSVWRLGREPNVVVTGAVPDVRPFLADARVSVAPLRIARGVQNKILEAMAMGVPVVATAGAAQGIDAGARGDLVIADDPREFAQCVVDILRDGSLRQHLSTRVRNCVEARYRWEHHLDGLEQILLSVGEGLEHPVAAVGP